MTTSIEEIERTMSLAKIAIGQIKAAKLPASPSNYAFWYSQAIGSNRSRNEAPASGASSREDARSLQLIGDQSSEVDCHTTDRFSDLGRRVSEELGRVTEKVDAAIGDVSHRFGSLRRASEELPIADRESLKTIVTSLVQSAKEMEEANRRLESNLRISKQQIGNLQQDLKKASSEALTDPLTSLGNRMLFDRELSRLIRQSSVPDGQVSLLMADIDHFKNINDSYGHQIGDQVIRLVAANIQKHLKGGDIGTRYGGEEFAVILDRTGLSEAFSIAEQIRRSVSVREFRKRTTGESMGRITISVGVASMQLGDTPQSLTDRADKCLYEAKRSGRNCVICSIKNTPVSL